MQSSADNPQITKETLNNLLLETTAALKNLNDNLTKSHTEIPPRGVNHTTSKNTAAVKEKREEFYVENATRRAISNALAQHFYRNVNVGAIVRVPSTSRTRLCVRKHAHYICKFATGRAGSYKKSI